jgi:plasmid stability protein
MAKTIQVRHVPDAVHRRLKAKAAMSGMSLSGYLLKEIQAVAAHPTYEEFCERVRQLPPVKLTRSSADIIREERNDRDRRLGAR